MAAAPTAKAPRVAVFEQESFPFYNASPLTSPRQIAANLRAAGIAADLLDAAALANPARLSARSYALVVLAYGNTFPQESFSNLRAFHRSGGSLIVSGVPFTHPVARLSALGWPANPGWNASVRVAQAAVRYGRRTGPTANTVGRE